MANVTINVPELQQSVTRPVVYDVVRQVCALTELPPDIHIYIPGDTDAVSQKGSTVSEQNEGTGNTRLSSENNVQVTVTENYDEGRILATAVSQSENLPIFYDEALGVTMRPAYSYNNVEINFRFTSHSRVLVERWRDNIRMRVSMARDINLHKLTYSYQIPKRFYELLQAIHKNREAVAGYGDDFATYLQTHSSTRLTRLSNQSGTVTGLAVAESQVRVQGMFDFEFAPERASREGQGEQWTITFAYKFSFDKPLMVNMVYPIIVHNALLPDQWLPLKQPTDFTKHNLSYSESGAAAHYYESSTRLDRAVRHEKEAHIPEFDEFIPQSDWNNTKFYMCALCGVDPSDPTLLLDLKELDEYNLDDDVLGFLANGEWRHFYKPFQSIMNVMAYRNRWLINHEAIFVDQNLCVRSTVPLDLRAVYRVRLGYNTNLEQLPPAALLRLRQNAVAGRKLLLGVHPTSNALMKLRYKCDLFPLVPEIKLDRAAWERFSMQLIRPKTVMTAHVRVHK